MNTTGERLVEMRELKHLTQAKLAELISMSPSQLNKYEKNKNNFTFGFRAKLSIVFSDEELDYIQYGDNVPKKHSIIQSGNGNIQQVGNGSIQTGLKPYDANNADDRRILQEAYEQMCEEDMKALDKEILQMLQFAPEAFKKNILAKLQEFKKMSEL